MFSAKLVLLLSLLYSDLGYVPVTTSGLRSVDHPIEIRKIVPGLHTQGMAVDLRCRSNCNEIVRAAQRVGFTGIGIYDKHIHLDIRLKPAIWRGKSK